MKEENENILKISFDDKDKAINSTVKGIKALNYEYKNLANAEKKTSIDILDNTKKITSALKSTSKAIKGSIAGFDQLYVISKKAEEKNSDNTTEKPTEKPQIKPNVNTGIPDFLPEGSFAVIQSVFDAISNIKEISTPLFSSISSTLSTVFDTFSKVFALISGDSSLLDFFASLTGKDLLILAIGTAISAVSLSLLSLNSFLSLAGVLSTAFATAITFLLSPMGLVVLALTAIIAVGLLLITHWDTICLVAKQTWDYICGVFKDAGKWFSDTVLKPLETGFKGTVNFIIGLAESFANCWIKAVNFVISALNKIQVSIPDWVPSIGGNSFGINISKMNEIKLPRLATGTVVPPNREFMAILGDNTREHEIVSPLSTIKQALSEVLLANSGNTGGKVVLTVDGRILGEAVISQINEQTKQTGVVPIFI